MTAHVGVTTNSVNISEPPQQVKVWIYNPIYCLCEMEETSCTSSHHGGRQWESLQSPFDGEMFLGHTISVSAQAVFQSLDISFDFALLFQSLFVF